MKEYKVTGMSCAACSARVEKAVSAVEGVESCSVNLLTNTMIVSGTAAGEDIIAAVEAAGYGVFTENKSQNKIKDTQTPIIKKRLWVSAGFLVLLMYLSMGHAMWGLPLPAYIADNPMINGICQLILAAAVMVINQKFFISGVKGLVHGAPNMDTLVALGSFASFGYSVYALFSMSNAQMTGDFELAMSQLHDLYFESAAMILTLITVGKMLESGAKGKTTSALEGLMKLAPKTATLLRDGEEVIVSVDNVQKGDVFIIRPGEQIPVDGTVLSGQSSVNESALTGESIPADKESGDSVWSGTINESGVLKCEATRVGEDTTLSQIISMVSGASATKAPISKIADKVSGVFVPIVIGIAVVTFVVWLSAGQPIGFAMARAISVLVISCPCALGLATPVAIMVGMGKGAKNGILFKTATSLEQTGKTQIIALDKTGTITEGNPTVVGIYPIESITETELLALAAAIEKNSEHPLARAINKKAADDGLKPDEVTDFSVLPGSGLRATLNGKSLYGGNFNFIKTVADVPDSLTVRADSLAEEGKTPLFFAADGKIIGIIAVADVIKTDSICAIARLREMGIRVIMLTGDNERTANAIGKEVGVDEIVAGVLPDGKEAIIRRLQAEGRVAMVGDGINDAPALISANTGIAIGAGADIAIDAADIVLVKNRLSDVVAAIRLSRATLSNIHQNLFWAFIYNIIGIPLAAGVWISSLGWKLNPMFGAAAMSLSSFCVVTNALRLNLVNIGSAKNKNSKKREVRKMEKIMRIEGMMCGHCEARVKKCLDELAGVAEAVVDHTKDTAVVRLNSDISDEVLKETVEAQGYTVTEIK